MRKFFTKIHLWLSIPVGLILTAVCLSGAALVFETEITETLNPHLYRTPHPGDARMLRPSQLAERVLQQTGDSLEIASLQFPGAPDGVCWVSFTSTGRRTLSVNPYTGEVNGWNKSYPFFQTMRKLHRWLLDPPAKKGEKSTGKVIVGVSTLLMVFILVSGLVIWFPRNRKSLPHRLKFSCTKGWRRFWYDSHVALGFYSTIFLLVMALTGLTWSFGWYRNAAYALFGGSQAKAVRPDDRSKDRPKEEGKKEEKAKFRYAVWDNVLADLQKRYPEYRSVTLNRQKAQILPDVHSSMRKADTAGFDVRTGQIDELVRYQDLPRQQTLKGWFYAFHTGSWGGTCTKVLYFLAAFVGGILPLSGYYLWLKKKTARRKK